MPLSVITSQPKPAKVRRLRADLALETLRSQIMLGHLKPGSPIAEPELAENLGVSRTPVREALKVLAAEGLVELRPNRRAIVARLDRTEMLHLFEMEALLESQAARLAAAKASDDDLAELARLQDRLEAHATAGRRKTYITVNQTIHRAIVASAHNPELTLAHARVLARLERARNVALSNPGRIGESVDEHRALLDALTARCGDRAAEIFQAHDERTAQLYLDGSLDGTGKAP